MVNEGIDSSLEPTESIEIIERFLLQFSHHHEVGTSSPVLEFICTIQETVQVSRIAMELI